MRLFRLVQKFEGVAPALPANREILSQRIAFRVVVGHQYAAKVGMAACVKYGDRKSATYKAMGRVTPADYFDGEDKNGKS